jgi:hypothetical protein
MEESNMAAPESTKYQVNFKTHKDGTLINVYADSIRELETQITDISMIAALIKSTEAELSSGAVPAAPAPTVAAVAAAFNATPVAAAPAAPVGATPTCRHGDMTYKTGTNARGPWKGYLCNAPKGADDKCEAIWVR